MLVDINGEFYRIKGIAPLEYNQYFFKRNMSVDDIFDKKNPPLVCYAGEHCTVIGQPRIILEPVPPTVLKVRLNPDEVDLISNVWYGGKESAATRLVAKLQAALKSPSC